MNLLKAKGFRLWLRPDHEDADLLACLWCGEKDGYELWADNPIELLGLVALYESKKPTGKPKDYWWRFNDENLYDELKEALWPDSPT